MASSFLVFFVLGLFNFTASIIQGVAGMGDAIILQVLWIIASEYLPQDFNTTPLGASPVRAVALIMYIRLLFMSPLVVYLGLNDSVFSKQMTLMMAVPSTIMTIVGVILYGELDTAALKKILGVTCFLFACLYIGIIVYRSWRKRRQVAELKARRVKLVVEADALAEEAQQSLNTSMANLQASFVQNVPNNSIFAMHAPASAPGAGPAPAAARDAVNNSHISIANLPGSIIVPQNMSEGQIDARTGLPAGTTEAYLSTIGGEVFAGPETQVPQVNEENVPPLTPSKISPSRTMTFTRVRINRNIDANGKIKMNTKIGAAVFASLSGIMASLTGVNAPPQIIFILLYDAPNYIVRVNFSAQSIPGNLIRFIMAVWLGSFTWDMLPLMLDVIIFGFAGVFVGNRVGRLLGPKSFNIFVLCLLLLCSLAMVGKWQTLLVIGIILTGIITAVSGYQENKQNKPIIEKQRQLELEVERRLYDCLEELQRNNSSFMRPITTRSSTASLEHLQRATRPRPMWSATNFDNDDEGTGDNGGKEGEISMPSGVVYPTSESGKMEDTAQPQRHANPPAPQVVSSPVQREVDLTKRVTTPAGTQKGMAVDDTDERTVPARMGFGLPRSATSASSDKSDEDSNGPPPSGNSTKRHRETSVPGDSYTCCPERPSPSLRSLDSSEHHVVRDEEADRIRRE